MFNRFRRTAAAAAAVIALGGGGVAWAASSASASAAPAAIGRCTSNNLAVWVNADSADGTVGTRPSTTWTSPTSAVRPAS